MASLFIGSVAGLCFPFLAGGLIDTALHAGKANLPVVGALSLNSATATLAGTIAMQALANASAAMFFGQAGQMALSDLRRVTYGRIIGLPMAFFSQRRVGELV
jgi:ABC-type multidrug transport system fused ATPase/permease subunit